LEGYVLNKLWRILNTLIGPIQIFKLCINILNIVAVYNYIEYLIEWKRSFSISKSKHYLQGVGAKSSISLIWGTMRGKRKNGLRDQSRTLCTQPTFKFISAPPDFVSTQKVNWKSAVVHTQKNYWQPISMKKYFIWLSALYKVSVSY
jgi:hypothetical protein